MSPRIAIDQDQIEEFCRRWKIAELSLFGSVLRDDFRPDSDVDVLVMFSRESPRTLDDFDRMERELQALFGHKVDLVQKDLLRNPFRRHHILTHRQILYAA